MRKVARLLIRVFRGFLLVLAAISAIVALALAIYGRFFPEVLEWFQAAVAAAAYAFAIGFMVPECGSSPRNIGKARKVLLALLSFEIATSVCAFVVYLALNQSLPITGLAFTSGFPYWGSIFGVDSTAAGVYLDIPLLVMVVFLYTLDKDALDDRADDAA